MRFHRQLTLSIALFWVEALAPAADPAARDARYFLEGELAGSLKSDRPLPLYDADPQSLANRLFAAFYLRTSAIPRTRGGTTLHRIEGDIRFHVDRQGKPAFLVIDGATLEELAPAASA